MAGAKPWMKFYPRDWRADEKLRDCSLAARGLWIEMLAIMHASERYGRLLVNGKSPSAISLARQVGAATDEIETLLDELREAGVFSTDAAGIIYSRRMKSDEKIAENARKHGKRGGNPKLCNKSGNPPLDKGADKGTDKGGLKLRGQSTESKDNIEKRKHSLPDDWEPEPFGEGSDAAAIIAGWTEKELAGHLEQFRDHHRARGNKFSDWQAAWGTWVRNSRAFAATHKPTARHAGSDDGYLERVLAEKAKREEWERRNAATAAGGR